MPVGGVTWLNRAWLRIMMTSWQICWDRMLNNECNVFNHYYSGRLCKADTPVFVQLF